MSTDHIINVKIGAKDKCEVLTDSKLAIGHYNIN